MKSLNECSELYFAGIGIMMLHKKVQSSQYIYVILCLCVVRVCSTINM